jgi:hypothetical protein
MNAPQTPKSKKQVGVRETVKLLGNEPKDDGDVNTYDCTLDPEVFAPRLKGMKNTRRTSTRRVIYVNGMGGNPKKHRAQACAVSAVAGTKVWGVYNGSRGFIDDLRQCLTDKMTSKLAMEAKAFGSTIVAAVTGANKKALIQTDLYDALKEGNPATASLFELLAAPGFEDARIVAHSQGNIIACNAINAIAVLKGEAAVTKLSMLSFGSPVTFWPDNLPVRKFGFFNDPITYLSLDTSLDHDEGYGYLTTVTVEDDSEVIQRWNDTRVIDYVNPYAQLSHAFYIYIEAYWDLLSEEFSQ